MKFYGYDAGGHMHGYGWIHDKPEFPEHWDEKKILNACIDTMKAKASAIAAGSGGREDTDLVVNETDTSRDNMGYRYETGEAHHVVLPQPPTGGDTACTP